MSKDEAAKALGVSVRILQRMTKRGEVGVQYVRGKKGDEAQYDAGKIERKIKECPHDAGKIERKIKECPLAGYIQRAS